MSNTNTPNTPNPPLTFSRINNPDEEPRFTFSSQMPSSIGEHAMGQEQMAKEILALRERAEKSDRDYASLKEQMAAIQAVFNTLQETNRILLAKLEENEVDIAKLEEQVGFKNTYIDSLQGKVRELNTKVAAQEDQLKTSLEEQQKREVSSQIPVLLNKVAKSRADLRTARQEFDAVAGQRDELLRQHDADESKITALEASRDKSSGQVNDLLKEIREQKEAHDELCTVVHNVYREAAGIHEEHGPMEPVEDTSAAKSQHETALAYAEGLREALQKQVLENGELRDKVDSLEIEAGLIQAELDEAQAVAALESKTLGEELTEAEGVERQNAEVQRLEEEMKHLQEAKDRLSIDCDRAKQQHQEAQELLSLSQENERNLAEARDRAEGKLKEAREADKSALWQISEMGRELEGSQVESQRQLQRIQGLQTVIDQLHDQRSNLEKEVQSLKEAEEAAGLVRDHAEEQRRSAEEACKRAHEARDLADRSREEAQEASSLAAVQRQQAEEALAQQVAEVRRLQEENKALNAEKERLSAQASLVHVDATAENAIGSPDDFVVVNEGQHRATSGTVFNVGLLLVLVVAIIANWLAFSIRQGEIQAWRHANADTLELFWRNEMAGGWDFNADLGKSLGGLSLGWSLASMPFLQDLLVFLR